MKKFLLFLTLLVSAIGLTHAKEAYYTIEFSGSENTAITKDNFKTTGVASKSQKYIGICSDVTRVYGTLKLGSGKGVGTITFSLAEDYQVNATKIVVNAANYPSDASSINVNSLGAQSLSDKAADYTFKLSGTEKLTSITLATVGSQKGKFRGYVYSVTVYYDDGTADDPKDCGIAWKQDEKVLEEGATVKATLGGDSNVFPTLSNPKNVDITYSSSDENVATIAADGTIKIKAIGSTTITASFAGDTNYDAKEVTFTLTVKKAQVAYLVTDASTLQPGDIIIIANQQYGKAMSTLNYENNRKTTDVTFNKGFSEISSIPDDALLLELEQSDTFWMFKTTNYGGTAGYLASQDKEDKNYLYVTAKSSFSLATISITDGVASIQFNEGVRNNLKYNSSSTLFSCYASGQDDVYIYKLATVTKEDPSFEFAAKTDDQNLNVIVLKNKFTTTTTANKVAIYMEDVLVGIYDVNSSTGEVNASFDHVPYLPTAEFTMRPVLATDLEGNPTQLGPSAPLSFTWPELNNENCYGYGLKTEKLFCVNEDEPNPWKIYGQFFFLNNFEKDNLDYSITTVEVVDNTDSSIKYESEFVWGDGGFYVNILNFFTSNKWDDATSHPDITECTVPVVKFIATPSYEFTYDTKYSSLVSGGAAAPARLTVPGATAVQTIVCTPQEVAISTLTNSNTVSGVEGVTVDGGAAVEYFNLQGVRVDGDLAPGIYIRRQGQSVSKVQIR